MHLIQLAGVSLIWALVAHSIPVGTSVIIPKINSQFVIDIYVQLKRSEGLEAPTIAYSKEVSDKRDLEAPTIAYSKEVSDKRSENLV